VNCAGLETGFEKVKGTDWGGLKLNLNIFSKLTLSAAIVEYSL
jgi:hypothetical protein